MNKLYNFPKLRRLFCLITFIIIYGGSYAYAQPLAQGMDKFLGGASSSNVYGRFMKYWNQITPGNDGKWGSVEGSRGNYNWGNLDKIYNFAVSNNIPFKEHVLVWGQQEPSWIASLSADQQRQAVEDWIKAISARYPQMAYVDVVNEPFHAVPSYKQGLGGDGATGWDWVITAFDLARKYCPPTAKLLLNEYSVLHSNAVTTDFLKLVNLLKDRNLIDGIAIQGHYFEFRSDMNAANKYVYDVPTIKNNLNRLTATGIPVYISEFDIDEPVDSNQVSQYKIYFPIFWSNPGVKGITFWGFYQYDVWSSHPNTFLIKSDGRERPALTWLKNYIKIPFAPVLQSDTAAVERNPYLKWGSSGSAKSYHVQVSEFVSFSYNEIDTTLADTVLQCDTLLANKKYYWRVSAVNEFGESDFSAASNFTTSDQLISGVEQQSGIPSDFSLSQNYPNPFNPSTKIGFNIPVRSAVTLTLFDVLGHEMKIITSGEYEPGYHEIELNASGLSAGVYFYKLQAGNFTAAKKLVLMK